MSTGPNPSSNLFNSYVKALFWGNFIEHCKQAKSSGGGERFAHICMAALEFLPILSQIVSFIETAKHKITKEVEKDVKKTSDKISENITSTIASPQKGRGNLMPVTISQPVTSMPNPLRPGPKIDEYNKKFSDELGTHFSQESILPGPAQSKLTGEEHINAILYQELVEKQRRKDVVLIPVMKENNQSNVLPKDFQWPQGVRYGVIALSVKNETHNTAIVLDTVNKKYCYFDSLGGGCPKDLIRQLKDKEIMNDSWKAETIVCPKQTDGWSCGFHTVANVLGCLKDPSKLTLWVEHDPDGNALRNKYVPLFTDFVKNHHYQDINRINKRQKTLIRDAIGTFIAVGKDATKVSEKIDSDGEKLKNSPLKDLYKELCTTYAPPDGLEYASLEQVQADFSKKYYNADNSIAREFLEAVTNPESPLYAKIPKELSPDLKRTEVFTLEFMKEMAKWLDENCSPSN